jgi:hypothetical protein
MRTWIDDHPDRYAYEVAELRTLGFEVDAFELRGNRRLVMRGSVATVRGDIDVVVVFPDTFPYLRPEVYAPGLRLERHQNIYEGNLCLLDRATAQWEVTDTGAWLVRERVPFLLELLEGDPAAMAANETPQGEPQSAYFRPRPGTVVFVPQEANAVGDGERSGMLELSVGSAEPRGTQVRALLARVTAKGARRGRVLATADAPLEQRFPKPFLEGPWVRLEQLPQKNTPEALLAAAASASPVAAKPRFHAVGQAHVAVIGIVFREEVGQGQREDGWLFVIVHREPTGPQRHRQGAYVIRGQRLSREDLTARTPQLRRLADKHVAVVGLGGVGSFIATELARAGVGAMTLVDGDGVEAGNTVRWPIGLTAVGHRKVDAVAGSISVEHPYTTVYKLDGRIGDAGAPDLGGARRTKSELDVLGEIVDTCDLVIDASAELGVQHLLSQLAAGRPQLHVWATEGAAGGAVARIDGAGGCWVCLQHALDDGTIRVPPADAQATVQPRGCASTTFTGAAFDLAPVSNQAVRMAVATLLGKADAEAAVCVLSLRDERGRWLSAPSWTTYPLPVSSSCGACHSRRAA